MNVFTHNRNGYKRGCRCAECSEDAVRRVAEWRARNRPAPCDVCHRRHQGACKPDDELSVRVCVTFPGWLHRAMVERVPWGERSRWLADLAAKELEA